MGECNKKLGLSYLVDLVKNIEKLTLKSWWLFFQSFYHGKLTKLIQLINQIFVLCMTLSGHTDISPNHLYSSLHCRCNLTSVTSAKQCWNPCSGPPKGLSELTEVCFAFPFILIGKSVVAFSTGQSWPRISALFQRQTSPDLSFVCGTGNQYMQNNIIYKHIRQIIQYEILFIFSTLFTYHWGASCPSLPFVARV